ncbi:tRNA dihydrouridine(20/20a) synthase DusA [Leptospira harrisiae]|uniref:tRNA-dihydrouridine(20/20a) synthase n=1 Tax=Leptospira harrisiae TaxID=2023189 RepID=A0A2N0AHK0_9LEPT|nr:tRNA dihydrouridine(20/20a) synthase DusA [Leptospira harrisiae]PJZ83754.1 tRNA dihydrouridine(20/20a) synthase DusA [Leptospira harrisiae]PKA07792.1 tRNA dihydrouridine(20/20a) synthase DusA [Leptospira harrisiae]
MTSPVPSYRISVAPMMDWTDRYFRFFMRIISKHALLYTEMVTTGAILRGKDNHRYLDFSKEEHPIALQLGGDSPLALAECAKIGESCGYNEINLNVGCPSDRVQSGSFGACLMKEPNLVAEMVSSCKAKVKIPVTVKHRIGVNGKETYEDLYHFVSKIKDAGVDHCIVHARIAILEGLSPKENRTVPPLRYQDVYQLKEDFPSLTITINGGIKTHSEIKEHLTKVDGVMIGRAAYDNPFLFHEVDQFYFGSKENPLSREEVLTELISYIRLVLKKEGKVHHILRHILGLYYGEKGAREYRKFLTDRMHLTGANESILEDYLKR